MKAFSNFQFHSDTIKMLTLVSVFSLLHYLKLPNFVFIIIYELTIVYAKYTMKRSIIMFSFIIMKSFLKVVSD